MFLQNPLLYISLSRRKSFSKNLFLVLCIASTLNGCRGQIKAQHAQFEVLTEQQLKQVQEALDPLQIPKNIWTYKRIRASDPVAATFEEYLFLSDGLFSRLSSKEELSFVLAHEYAHKRLGHDRRKSFPLNIEKEADRVALTILLRSKICHRSAITALSRMIDSRKSQLYSSNSQKNEAVGGTGTQSDFSAPPPRQKQDPEQIDANHLIFERIKALHSITSRLPTCP